MVNIAMKHNKGGTRMMDEKRLAADKLHQHTDPDQFDFETTADLPDLEEVVGQPRAVEAIRFGMGINAEGYNIFAMGPSGTGKRGFIRQFFKERAGDEPIPSDWCYVHDFDHPHRPSAIKLPAGKGVEFEKDMDELVEELKTALSAAFESEEYQTRRQSVTEELKERQAEAFEELQGRAEGKDVALIRTPAGLAVAPVKDGDVLSPEEIQELSEEEQERLKEQVSSLQEEVQAILQQVPGWQRKVREKLNELNREIANFAVGGLIDELKEKYSEHPKVVEHLEAVQESVVENADEFLPEQGQEEGNVAEMLRKAAGRSGPSESMLLRRYKVNVLVDHSETEGAPVVYEGNPTYQNLIGRVEHQARMGALFTDFQLIKAGALHRANGGYLILDARKVLLQPYAWEGLKRALSSDEVHIESVAQMYSLISTVSLEPEPIPLDVKVALFGDRMIYYLLHQLDPDFSELFKVKVDFEEQMDRNGENQELYARLIGSLIQKEDLRPFNPAAVARVIERSARMVGDSDKLSTQVRDVTDLLREADYWAGERDHEIVHAEDVQQAIDAQVYRSDRLRERIYETILRDTFFIDTTGEVVGQINGLSVLQLGDFAFGRPTRITARVQLGKGQVVDIEREVELGGPIHSKGVFILSAFLGGRYAEDRPLSLSASLVFEQSYGGIEGDSASSAELYALLSAIAEVPIQQSLAVTGSVNQHGKVQPIGGVNEKIEGFFDICEARGLTGQQGVLIPESNVKHLMLREDVVEAVSEGRFHIYAVDHVDEGIEILTGIPAGERDEEGNYPEGTINHMVEQRLDKMAKNRKQFASQAKSEEEEETEEEEGEE
jgi:lon-related putative ATP-dependent protease